MKKLLVVLVFMIGAIGFAQDKNVEIVQKGDIYEATYFHDNGEVAQTGFFNAEGKLHGTWKSFDANGNKVAMGNYENGKKTGKWMFWNADKLTEVDYKNFKMEKVNEWKNKTQLAIRD